MKKIYNIISYKEILEFFYAIYAIITVWLAFNHNQYMPMYKQITDAIPSVCAILGGGYFIIYKNIAMDRIWYLLLPITYILLVAVNFNGVYKGEGVIFLFTVASYILFPKDIKIKIFNYFYWLVLLANVISIILFICIILQLDIGFESLTYYAENSVDTMKLYIKWFIFAIFVHPASETIRMCSIFNEPGALGTLCALFFICKYNISSKFEKVVWILSGILTFSLAFYFMVAIFVILKNIKIAITNILVLICLIIFLLSAPYIDFGNQQINDVAYRLEIASNGLAGDNRLKDDGKKELTELFESDDVCFGRGYGYRMAGGSLSIVTTIVIPFGIIGSFFMLGEWVLVGIKETKLKKDTLIFLIVFLLSLYQRPNAIINIYGYILLIGGCEEYFSKIIKYK